jgi:hypothetical protein
MIQVGNDAASHPTTQQFKLAMMQHVGCGRNQRCTEIQQFALKMHRNVEVPIADGVESRNISWQSCCHKISNVASMNSLECCMIAVFKDATHHGTRHQFKLAMMPQVVLQEDN